MDTIESDPDVLRDVLLATADRRDPAVRARRAHVCEVTSKALARCYAQLFADPDGHAILDAERTRNELGLTLAATARTHVVERAITRLSDLVRECRDPAFRTARQRRRRGIFRRPGDGLPLFQPAQPVGCTGAFYGERDALEWRFIALEPLHLVDADGEKYVDLVPSSGANAEVGVIPFDVFCTWRNISLSRRYKAGERKVPRDGRRVVRQDEPIVGLHEDAFGRLMVDLRLHLLDEIARRTGAWSAAAHGAKMDRAAAREATKMPTSSVTGPLTRTERFLEQLRREGADVEHLRTMWNAQVAEERRLGIYR
ncbi:MAG TPA: hypothetical protein VFN10_19405 [Thermoanaerobaculia bacterium]|nr:hypothetical protein [Thermoanaerobaculia bacterium]